MPNLRTLTISTPDGQMPADWYPPSSSGAPTLVVCQEIFGVTDYIKGRCADLQAAGYGVLAPHFYWRLGSGGAVPVITEADADALQRAMATAGALNFDDAVADGAAAYAFARHDATQVGLIGFCYGGSLAFAIAARTDPAVLISYYGSALPDLLDLSPDVTAPSLHHFGEADSFIDAAAQDRIRQAVTAQGAEWRSYPGADHAFDNVDASIWHHPEAAAAAWQVTQEFLRRKMPIDPIT